MGLRGWPRAAGGGCRASVPAWGGMHLAQAGPGFDRRAGGAM